MNRRHSTDSSDDSLRKAKRQPTTPSILMLNDFCLLEIFKCLELDDFISLSSTCKRLKNMANFFNQIYSEFKINVNLENKQKDYMEFIIANMKENIAEISIDYHHSKIPMNVKKMSKSCQSVKNLHIANWKVNVTDGDWQYFDNLETLTMTECNFFSGDGFFEIFKNLKVVNFCRFHYLSARHLRRLFRDNFTIESFVWLGNMEAFDEFELFGMLPRLAALSLRVDREINYFDFGSQFSNLTKLQLFCNGENISEFLHAFAKSAKYLKLKELELLRVRVDDLFFYSLFYFQQLELLVISTWSYWRLQPPLDWPQKLKHLRLDSFVMSKDGLISTIKQLDYIEDVDVEYCSIAEEDVRLFSNMENLSQVISTALTDKKQKVNFLLNLCRRKYDPEMLYIVDTERLRIFHNARCKKKDHLGVSIHFRGIDKSVYL